MKIMLDFCQKSVNFMVIRMVGWMVYFPGKTGKVGKSALYSYQCGKSVLKRGGGFNTWWASIIHSLQYSIITV